MIRTQQFSFLILTIQRRFLYLFLLLLPTQLGKHFWPQSVLLSGIRVDYLSPTIYLIDIVIAVIILLEILHQNVCGIKRWIRLIEPSMGLVWGILIWGVLQSIWVHPSLSQLIISFKLAAAVGLVGIITKAHLSKKHICRIFIFHLILQICLATAQFASQKSLDGVFYYLGERHMSMSTPGIALENTVFGLRFRPYGTFSHPNTLAGFTLILSLWIFLSGEVTSKKKLGFLLGGSAWLLYLTYSQASWLVVGFTGCLWLYKKKFGQDNNRLPLALILCFLTPLILLGLPRSFQTSETSVRNYLFSKLLTLSWFEWLGGVGWQGFLTKLAVVNQPVLGRVWLQPLHNCLWYLITSLGLVVSSIIVVYLLRTKPWQALQSSSQTLLTIIIILGAFDHYWLTQPQTLYLLIFILGDHKGKVGINERYESKTASY